jgi:hypothetical protein
VDTLLSALDVVDGLVLTSDARSARIAYLATDSAAPPSSVGAIRVVDLVLQTGDVTEAASIDLSGGFRRLRAVDWDGDGTVDLVASGHIGGDSAMVARGNADGTFAAPLDLPVADARTVLRLDAQRVALLRGSGILEVRSGDGSTATLDLLSGLDRPFGVDLVVRGADTLVAVVEHDVPTGREGITEVRLELVVVDVRGTDPRIVVRVESPTGASAINAVSGDIDGDGQLDVAVSCFESREVVLALGEAGGGLGAPQSLWVDTPSPFGVAFTDDRDGDGASELIATNSTGGQVAMFGRRAVGGTIERLGQTRTNRSATFARWISTSATNGYLLAQDLGGTLAIIPATRAAGGAVEFADPEAGVGLRAVPFASVLARRAGRPVVAVAHNIVDDDTVGGVELVGVAEGAWGRVDYLPLEEKVTALASLGNVLVVALEQPAALALLDLDATPLALGPRSAPIGGAEAGVYEVDAIDLDADGVVELVSTVSLPDGSARLFVHRTSGAAAPTAIFDGEWQQYSAFTWSRHVFEGDFEGDGRSEALVGSAEGLRILRIVEGSVVLGEPLELPRAERFLVVPQPSGPDLIALFQLGGGENLALVDTRGERRGGGRFAGYLDGAADADGDGLIELIGRTPPLFQELTSTLTLGAPIRAGAPEAAIDMHLADFDGDGIVDFASTSTLSFDANQDHSSYLQRGVE